LVVDGWKVGKEIEKDDKKKNEWQGRIIPKQLMINRYFSAEQKAIDQLEIQQEDTVRQQEEMVEEHSGEDGLLEEVTNDKGNITKGEIRKRIREIKDDLDYADELKVLEAYLQLLNTEADIKKQIKTAQTELNVKLLDKYKKLTENEIKTLVVDDKWLIRLEGDVQSEMQRISQRLTGRIIELAERYETPLPQQEKDVEMLTGKVEAHLKKMGFVWK
jgi:type I restriction enzyme M protein